MIKPALKSGVLFTIASVNCINAFAQETDQLHVNVGEVRFFPSVTLEYVSNDNVLRNSDAVSTSGVVVAPQALFVADRRGLDVRFGYDGAYGAYDEESINFADHHVFGNADAVFGVRKRGTLEMSVLKGHQPLGGGLTRNNAQLGDAPVELVEGKIDTSFTYGATSARFNAAAGLLLFTRSFQNRADVTDGRGHTEVTPSAGLTYRLSADTRALLQVRVRSLKFDNSALDRDELQVLTGLVFKGSGKLSGVAKFGAAQPSYEDSSREDESILTVDTTLTYKPSTLSTFDLRFVRQLDNGGSLNQLVDAGQIIDDSISLSWRKKWSGFVNSTAIIAADLENGGCPVDRTDEVRASLDVGLMAKRWMTFGLGVETTTYSETLCDTSSTSNNDYDLVELKAFVTLTL